MMTHSLSKALKIATFIALLALPIFFLAMSISEQENISSPSLIAEVPTSTLDVRPTSTQPPSSFPITEASPTSTQPPSPSPTIEASPTDTNHGENAPPISNQLANEKSPYLQQHADNLINWHPWGPEAFEKARTEDKPIFLSIGYSACHWCHVMEEESFEDPDVARLMNETFVAILVDREERPDIDNIYMDVSIMMTGGGGWPLNIIMSAEQKPFFAGTYIPKESRFEQLGMLDLTRRVQEVWQNERAGLLDVGEKVFVALEEASANAPGQPLDSSTLALTYQQLDSTFDPAHGGFGSGSKFPTPHQLFFLLRYGERSGEAKALGMVESTLQAMRRGGIYDHLGYGFHRYTIDSQWRVPHFEKMLYDQAMLTIAYSEAYQATQHDEYAQTVRETLTYVLRDMTAAEGGFYSAEDADSEGEEGTFYLWREDEIRQALSPEEAELIISLFNFQPEGNYAEEVTRQPNGTNILYITSSLAAHAQAKGVSEAELTTQYSHIRQTLFTLRATREAPLRDDKILTDWNGLMIAAFAKASRALNEPLYADSARHAADFVLATMRDSKGELWHRYADGEVAMPATLDDYAFFVWGLLELYESTFDIRYLQEALALTNTMNALFWDSENGAYYFTTDDTADDLLVRKKEINDGAIPSGNAVAMLNLLRLGRITINPDFEAQAAQITEAFAGHVEQAPSQFTHLMSALDFALGPSYEVVIVGEPGSPDTQAMLTALRSQFVPNKVVLFRAAQGDPDLAALAEFTEYQTAINNQATAYVCLNYYCELPTNDITQMLGFLEGN